MSRGLAYRRYMKEINVIRRAKKYYSGYYFNYWTDVNNRLVLGNQKTSNYIGTQAYFGFKTYSTSKSDSHNKSKYSDKAIFYGNENNTRIKNKKYFRNLLKEHGII